MSKQKDMFYDFGLLFDPVFFQPPSRLKTVIIAAKGVAPKRQEKALLVLPDVHKFVNEQPLQV